MSENYGLGFRGFSIRLSRLIVIVVVKAFTCLCTEKLQPNLHTVDDTLIMQPTNYFQTNGSFKFACLLLFRWAVLLFFFVWGGHALDIPWSLKLFLARAGFDGVQQDSPLFGGHILPLVSQSGCIAATIYGRYPKILRKFGRPCHFFCLFIGSGIRSEHFP